MINWLIRWFSTTAEAKYLQNKISHLVLDYNSAKVKINQAKKTFDKVVEHTVKDFESKKKSTLEKTLIAVDEMKTSISKEGDKVEEQYWQAKDKLVVKAKTVDSLQEIAKQIGGTEFPLQ